MNPPFNDITPPEGLPRQPMPNAGFAVAGFHGALYVAELVHDAVPSRERCRILGYDFDRTGWNSVVSLERSGEGEAAGAPPSAQFLRLREPGTAEDALFVRFTSPLGTRLFRLAPGGEFQPLAEAGPLIEACFASARLADVGGRMFGLGCDEGGWPGRIARHQQDSGGWQAVDLPAYPDGGKRTFSEIAAFDGALYAATVDGERGFELWRAQGTEPELRWKLVFERGAWRYAHNREVLGMAQHGGALYLITGTSIEARRPESKFIDYQGFEVIRVAPDGIWDLLVGVPRFSPAGLVVPFSGLGAGMHSDLRLEFRLCLSLGNRLLMGLHGINGFQLWTSTDGEKWAPLTHPELSAIHQVDDCDAIPVGERLVLVLRITDALGQQATEIWAGQPGEAAEC